MLMSSVAMLFILTACPFDGPGHYDATMEVFTRNIVKVYYVDPLNSFKPDSGEAWISNSKSVNLRYIYSPIDGESWRCTIEVTDAGEQRYPLITGVSSVQFVIEGSNSSSPTTIGGCIDEADGYKTTLTGSVTNWTGVIRVETSQNGVPLNWGEATFSGSEEPIITTGSYLK